MLFLQIIHTMVVHLTLTTYLFGLLSGRPGGREPSRDEGVPRGAEGGQRQVGEDGQFAQEQEREQQADAQDDVSDQVRHARGGEQVGAQVRCTRKVSFNFGWSGFQVQPG